MAETLASMMVKIGADISGVEKSTNQVTKEFKSLGAHVGSIAKDMGQSAKEFGDKWRTMSNEMKEAYQESQKKLMPFKQAQKEVQHGFFKLSQSMGEYKGTTQEFMTELNAMGKQHKKITDEMVNNNNFMRQGFIQNVAVMQARSSQSEKIAQNFDKMNNPLYTVNNGLLKVTQGLETMAKRGQAAHLALQMLGPNASMKELRDMTMMINRGLMRFTMVALAAAVASAVLYGALHEASKSIPGYAEAFEAMTASVRQAFQPMVEVFAAVMTEVYEFITYMSNLVIKFNEAHPVLAKILQGILLLIPALVLLLSPLAIGIGLIAGFKAAFASVWMLIGPLITGLGAMMGTVLLVAAAIVLVSAALWALWTKTDWFKGAVLSVWESIKTATQMAWDWIMNNVIAPVVSAIQSFIQEKMEQIRKFWDENGQMILQAGKNVWKVILSVIKVVMIAIGAIMTVVWPVVKVLIISTWNAIKMAIDGAINVILGIIKFFAALFTGDWGALWDATKQILLGAVQLILGLVQLSFIGGMLKGVKAFGATFKTLFGGIWETVKGLFTSGISSVRTIVTGGFDKVVSFITGLGRTFFNAGKGLIDEMAKGITNAASAVIKSVKSIAGKIRDFLPFSPAKMGPLADLDKLDFGGPISDSILKGKSLINSNLSNILELPSLSNFSLDPSTTQNEPESSKNHFSFDPIHIHIGGEGASNLDQTAIAKAVEERIIKQIVNDSRRLPNRFSLSGVR